MKKPTRLERLLRVRRAQRSRAQMERADTAREAREAHEAVAQERGRLRRNQSRFAESAREGLPGDAWSAAARGLVAGVGRVRERRAHEEQTRRSDSEALARLHAARQKHEALERLLERLRRERLRREDRRQQREIDERASTRHRSGAPGDGRDPQRLHGWALLAITGLMAAALALPATETAAEPSSSESAVIRLLEDIRQRQSELDERERDLEDRRLSVERLEQTADERLAEVQRIADAVETRIAEWEDAHGSKSISRLAKIYGTMEPRGAAQLIEDLEIDLATRIFAKMKAKQSAAVLPLLSDDRALAMSRKVAHPLSSDARSAR